MTKTLMQVWHLWREDGKVSATVFRFLKGMEGFSRYPYTDSAGYSTIAYGITEIGEKQVYDELKAQVPLDEEVLHLSLYWLSKP